jgi:aryl sulfotransferase
VSERTGTVVGERKRYRSFIADSARWDGFELRDGDVIISTPSKCGTTWTQMICALLILDTAEFDRPLTELSPWLDMQLRPREVVWEHLAAQQHRRFIKTHTPLDGLPEDERVTYVCVGRDPRDAWLSWQHHLANMDFDTVLAERAAAVGMDDLEELGPLPVPPPDDPVEAFWLWAGPEAGEIHDATLAGVLAQFRASWDRRHDDNVLLLHYSDLSADLPAQMRRLADALAIDVTDARIEDLAVSAGFDRMRARASHLAPVVTQRIWRDDSAFFRRGGGGEWRELLDEADLERYAAAVATLVPPDLAAWAHGGWGASDSSNASGS